MTKKKQQTSAPVFYIKLPAYIVPFMTKRHGNPMSFGILNRYTKVIADNLICNKFLNHFYTDLSCSEYAYKLATADKVGIIGIGDNDNIPADKDLSRMVAVRLPEEVLEMCPNGMVRAVDTNWHYQLTRKGAQEFRDTVAKEFWHALGLYIYEEQHKVHPLSSRYKKPETRKDLLYKFILSYDIDTDHFENIYRHMARSLKNHEFD